MPRGRILHLADDSQLPHVIQTGITHIQQEMGVSDEFPSQVQRQAESVVRLFTDGPPLPDTVPWLATHQWRDFSHLPFVTIDPASSMDLDQALYIEPLPQGSARHQDGLDQGVAHKPGFRIWYAIADVAAFVEPGSALDREAHHRGQTLYGADSRIPLYPPALSEGGASLLPDVIRPALIWRHDVDAAGLLLGSVVERGVMRSRLKLSYHQAQLFLDGVDVPEISQAPDSAAIQASLNALAVVGQLRIEQEIARGGVSLPSPEQEIIHHAGRWELEFRRPLAVEDFNAQLSLLTGFAAAEMMLEAEVGIIRTLPPPPDQAVQDMRAVAHGLRIPWPSEQTYPAFIRSLDPANPRHAAMVDAATSLLRGSGYAGFIGTLPELTFHAGVGSEYAHVTAPLRRLVDRYALEVCVALCAGVAPPAWVLAALPQLPKLMQRSGQQASQYFRNIVDLVEAGILQHRVGETFQATVIDTSKADHHNGMVMIADPAIEAPVESDTPLPLGSHVYVTLVEADPLQRRVRFTLTEPGPKS